MKPNKLLLIVTIICITPLLIMSTNNEVEIVSHLEPVKNTKTTKNNTLDLEIGDQYFDIKIKVPHFKVASNANQNVVINTTNHSFILDQKATKNTTKYTVSNVAKITNIIIKK
ncbi:hypothetical protein [Olleya sp. AS48]|jgi:hypothetical protein|uniref:hypothetical protein n=1 Tax=Olleya sp. AS48 TaxID=3135774 RepID=UPI0030D74B46|tara:strand:+ start:77370 stop:77708 length:339 start_codon:yes stop_codon:yes gene_type:complete